MKEKTLLVAVALIVALSAAQSESDGAGKWQLLTKQNFSSQIRLHPHILLLVSVPWSGESRSLKKEITQMVSDRSEEFGSLKLMYIERNTEKMLADAIGATESISVLYYHQSVSYKYKGRLCSKNILFSVLPYMSVSPEEIPLKVLSTQEDLKTFIDSTDKALLLFEFCAWTPKLMANKKNGTESVSAMQGSFSGTSFNNETTRISTPSGKKKQKVEAVGIESANMTCGMDNGFSGIPSLGDYSSANDSALPKDTESYSTENLKPNFQLSCTFEEFQRFESFFSSFMNVAREFFLPPERHGFGVVSERSLLSSLGVGDSGSWLTMLYFNGCPGCAKILKEGDDLKSLLRMHESIVVELESDAEDLVPAVPPNKPSVLLFVDRSSDSSETRRKSKEALDVFRALALHHQISGQMNKQNREKRSVNEKYGSMSRHPRLNLSPKTQTIKLKDKMSIMIVNEGKHAILDNIASDLQGDSLQEILTNLLQQKKEAKLSAIAKEFGFQLLSDDFGIKLSDTLPSEPKLESKQLPVIQSKEDLVATRAYLDKDPNSNDEERSQPSGISSSQDDDKDDTSSLLTVTSDQFVSDEGQVKGEQEKLSQVENLGEQLQLQGFEGSFYFSDGNYRLLRVLTGEARIPSVVIIDPTLQQHYVFPEQRAFSYSSLEDFVSEFLNGSLVPYQLSESESKCPREGVRPPFVNLDFHEVDSIPRVTARTFTEQIIGFNQSDNDNSAQPWNEDVLVLFSNSWCGFCQRMELVVREVYWAVKGYINMLKTGSGNVEADFSSDNLKNAIPKLPKIFLMDCTMNDCSLILKLMNQREVYPTLLLFPAERKTAVSFEGDMAVADVIKFIAEHGSNSKHLTSQKGILWAVAKKGSNDQNLFKDASLNTGDTSIAKDKSHEILLKNPTPKKVVEYSWIKPHGSKALNETAPHVVVGSILFANEKLSVPFDKSMILIVKAEQYTGFQGLIFNKPIRWDSLQDLGEGLELLKEAPLSFGGPLIKRGMPFVALTRRVVKDQYPEVLPGIYFLDELATLNEIEQLKSGNQSLADYWFFLGFSSWGWDQLFDEIAQGAWSLTESTGHFDWPSS